MDVWPSNGYIFAMGTHSVAEAKNRLSSLIDQAMRGEEVVITRHGRPVVALRPLSAEPSPLTDQDVEWLAKHRVGSMPSEDAATLVRRMRDEDAH
jgi:prevent-host-death family protein